MPQGVTPKSNRIGTSYNPKKPLFYAPVNDMVRTPIYGSMSHGQAHQSWLRNPRNPSNVIGRSAGRTLRGMGLLGQTPALLRNAIDISAIPVDFSGQNPNAYRSPRDRQRDLEISVQHNLNNLGGDALISKLGGWAIPTNMVADMIYQHKMPEITNLIKQTRKPMWDYEDNHLLNKSGIQIPNTNATIQDPVAWIAELLNSDAARKYTVPIANAKLPPQLKGYRGHMMASVYSRNGKPDYGDRWLDLLTDILNPAGYAGAQAIQYATPFLALGQKTKSGRRYNWNDLTSDYKNELWPMLKKDLDASITGFGKNMSESFIP